MLGLRQHSAGHHLADDVEEVPKMLVLLLVVQVLVLLVWLMLNVHFSFLMLKLTMFFCSC